MSEHRFVCVVAVTLLAVTNVGWSQAADESRATPVYAVDRTWPQKPADCQWAATPGLAVDAQDRVYVFTRAVPPIQVYEASGKFVRSWNNDSILTPHQMRVDRAGNVWVTDIGTHTVQKFSPDGKLIHVLGTPLKPGCDETHFNKPTDVTILPSGDIYVSDGYGNRRIVQFDKTGKFVRQWGEQGTAAGQFALPHSIVADSQGRLYVADRENARVQVFDTAGKVLAVWENLVTPWGLHITPQDELWVCGSSPVKKEGGGWLVTPPKDQVLMKLRTDGHVLLRMPLPKIAEPPGQPGEVDWVHGVTVDSQGSLYVGDIQGKRVQKFVVR